MGKKIKITEKQFNMIVETVIKKNYINENINEEQLEEGKLSQIAGALAILATTLFPGKSEAAAVSQMQKEYPELVQKVQADTSKPITKSYDSSKPGVKKFFSTIKKDSVLFDMVMNDFVRDYVPRKVGGKDYDSLTYGQLKDLLQQVIDGKHDSKFSTTSINHYIDHYSKEDVIRLQQLLKDSGASGKYLPMTDEANKLQSQMDSLKSEFKKETDASKKSEIAGKIRDLQKDLSKIAKENLDGNFGAATAKAVADNVLAQLAFFPDDKPTSDSPKLTPTDVKTKATKAAGGTKTAPGRQPLKPGK
jgi:hypothetical protein